MDRSFELPDNVVLTELNHELRDADLLVCFGGDGTILHASKAATKAGIPVLGVNIGTMGFMAELESSELKELRRLADDDFSVEPRMMLHVRAEHEGRVILEEDALNDAVIILDEAQNTTTHQMKMFLTRLGMNSKMVVTGDVTQIDLPHSVRSGLLNAMRILKGVKGIGVIEYEKKDIVRHPLVQRIVDAYEHREKEVAAEERREMETEETDND